MPLHLPDPPAGVPDRVRAKLQAFADGAKFSTKALRGARKDRLDVSTPHQVFTMGIDDITSGAGLDGARPAGWRYLVEEGGQLIASAETTQAPDGTHEVSRFTEGPFVAETDRAVKAVRRLPQLEAAGFELRLLRIPALYVMALWLHAPTTDLLVPLAPSPIGKEGRPLPAAEFLADLPELIRQATPPA
ncbi:hypothetical protein [Saccharothrix syringae]|uniref:Uncharacterized protein n=1 Tax=Saccharothrix syringae TaxID=103733 RepID=A0A5Q0H0T8_SACSY|nr:hypothetical protein [Saccharothrix syringae]QFZ19876.1 hypothetical protein EKG83_22780 [Saccharothrix syringae]